MQLHAPDELLDRTVVSGLGIHLGVVVDVERNPRGAAERLVVREDGGMLREVEAMHVRCILPDRVELKGPREGFHIAPLGPPGLDPCP